MLWIAGETKDSHLDEVYRDGVREPLAVRANAAQGYVTRYATDPVSQEVLRNGRGEPETELVFGDVEIRRVN
jgi:hypothetical protein